MVSFRRPRTGQPPVCGSGSRWIPIALLYRPRFAGEGITSKFTREGTAILNLDLSHKFLLIERYKIQERLLGESISFVMKS